ncbi:integrase catalytic domain-containing protein [Trichonephila clavipes]|nr:integrase catalytic domain-containing protein [Trichonephila clavipes]
MYKNALKEDFIRVVEDLDGTVESTDTIAKLKTKIENSSTFESDPDFVKTLIKNCIDERVSRNEREVTLEKQKIELAKLQLAQLEKEVELQTAKNEALSLNPAAKVEDKQFETNIENMIKSIRTLSLPVPTRSENFNLFFQSLERAFLTKKINDEYKSEILINLLGERAHNVLLYIKEEELNDYEKLKSIVLREFQLTPRECLRAVGKATKETCEHSMAEAVREAVDENDGKRDLLLLLLISWQKRGFSSKNGLVTVTSVDTGKVIDVEVFFQNIVFVRTKQASSKL